jgi:hypothetical protein
MALSEKNPGSTGVTAGATEPTAHIIDVATSGKDNVAETVKDDEKPVDELKKPKKKPEATLGNYFVSAVLVRFMTTESLAY